MAPMQTEQTETSDSVSAVITSFWLLLFFATNGHILII